MPPDKRRKSLAQEPFRLRTRHAELSAVLHPSSGRRIVIFCHGFTANKVENQRLFVQAAEAFQTKGLSVLRFDFMGSGESSGTFRDITPNTQIRDALEVLRWGQQRFEKTAFLGLSLGAATAICAAYQAKRCPDALLTWSSVPSFRWWRIEPPAGDEPQTGNPLKTGPRFFTERPPVDVPEAYRALCIPRLQIQGDNDLPEFRERFEAFFPTSDPAAHHLIIPGADHAFTQWPQRRRLIRESAQWLLKTL